MRNQPLKELLKIHNIEETIIDRLESELLVISAKLNDDEELAREMEDFLKEIKRDEILETYRSKLKKNIEDTALSDELKIIITLEKHLTEVSKHLQKQPSPKLLELIKQIISKLKEELEKEEQLIT